MFKMSGGRTPAGVARLKSGNLKMLDLSEIPDSIQQQQRLESMA
jgi:hypothetical protein